MALICSGDSVAMSSSEEVSCFLFSPAPMRAATSSAFPSTVFSARESIFS